jgi:hypothetical protein
MPRVTWRGHEVGVLRCACCFEIGMQFTGRRRVQEGGGGGGGGRIEGGVRDK